KRRLQSRDPAGQIALHVTPGLAIEPGILAQTVILVAPPPDEGLVRGSPQDHPDSRRTQETCVMRWSRAAKEMAALVAAAGVALEGKVASVASPTRKTLKSGERFW